VNHGIAAASINRRLFQRYRRDAAQMERAEQVCSARVIQTSTCSAMARASSPSMPRYRTVLSIFVCPFAALAAHYGARPIPTASGAAAGRGSHGTLVQGRSWFSRGYDALKFAEKRWSSRAAPRKGSKSATQP